MVVFGVQPADRYKVQDIKTLGKLNDVKASEMLLEMARQVQPIMRKYKWHVPLLSEFYPRNPNLLGLNIGGGGGNTLEIKVRLRRAESMDAFFPYEHVLGTMLHELVHNVHGPHAAPFYKLLDTVTQECEELMAKGIKGSGAGFDAPAAGKVGGRSLATAHNLPPHKIREAMLKAAQERAALRNVLPCGPQRLGGDMSLKETLPPALAAAMAAKRRCRDNTWCPSGRNGAAIAQTEEDDVEILEAGPASGTLREAPAAVAPPPSTSLSAQPTPLNPPITNAQPANNHPPNSSTWRVNIHRPKRQRSAALSSRATGPNIFVLDDDSPEGAPAPRAPGAVGTASNRDSAVGCSTDNEQGVHSRVATILRLETRPSKNDIHLENIAVAPSVPMHAGGALSTALSCYDVVLVDSSEACGGPAVMLAGVGASVSTDRICTGNMRGPTCATDDAGCQRDAEGHKGTVVSSSGEGGQKGGSREVSSAIGQHGTGPCDRRANIADHHDVGCDYGGDDGVGVAAALGSKQSIAGQDDGLEAWRRVGAGPGACMEVVDLTGEDVVVLEEHVHLAQGHAQGTGLRGRCGQQGRVDWTCGSCTLRNDALHLQCDACGTPRI